MIVMALTPLGPIDEDIMAEVQRSLEARFPVNIVVTASLPVPVTAWDSARRQFNAPLVLQGLQQKFQAQAGKVLAVMDADLFIPMLTFVYGQAQLGGRLGLVSLARLRQEYYSLPAHPRLLADRARKEAVHETGHLFSLVHCNSPACVMRVSTNIHQIDLKNEALCPSCASLALEYA